MTPARYWDEMYGTSDARQVSWFQQEPRMSLELIDTLGLAPDDPVVDIGGGASTLVDRLLDRGHRNITVLDISAQPLGMAQDRLGARAEAVCWETADVREWTPDRRFMLWHDRAVFHFLVAAQDQDRYVRTAAASIVEGGHLLVGTFAVDGPEQCSGLPVVRYGPDDLTARLGAAFAPVAVRAEVHHTPNGVAQPFTWLLSRRTGEEAD